MINVKQNILIVLIITDMSLIFNSSYDNNFAKDLLMYDTQEYLLKKLLYKSKNRGCKETDLILGNFAEKFIYHMNIDELNDFARILEASDANIYDWFTNKASPPDHINSKVLQQLLMFNIRE